MRMQTTGHEMIGPDFERETLRRNGWLSPDEAARLTRERDDVRRALDTALRQWRMYAELEEARDLATEKSTEGDLYRAALRVSTGEGTGQTPDRLAFLTDRFAFLTDLIRQHRCIADGAMTVAECVDSDRCRCCVGLITRASTGEG